MIKEITISDEMQLSEAIKRLRKDSGYTLDELASKSQVSPSAISRYENGQRVPTLKSFTALMEALGVGIFIVNK